MTAEQYKLVFDVQQRGNEQLVLVDKTLKDIDKSGKEAASSTSTLQSSLIKIGEAVAGIVIAERALRGVTSALFDQTRALIEHRGAFQSLIDTHRVYSIGSAAMRGGTLAATGVGIAIGGAIAVEQAIQLSSRFAEELRTASFAAARGGTGIRSVLADRNASSLLGTSITGGGDLLDTVNKLKQIEDPAIRAAQAFALMGGDADKASQALALTNKHIESAILTSIELANAVDGKARIALGRMKDSFDQLGEIIPQIKGKFSEFAAEMRQGIAIRVALILTGGADAAQRGLAAAPTPSGGVEGPGGGQDIPFGYNADSISRIPFNVPRLGSILRDATGAGLGTLPNQPTAGGADALVKDLESRAKQIEALLAGYGDKLERLQFQQSRAEENLTKAIEKNDTARVRSSLARIASIEAQIKAERELLKVQQIFREADMKPFVGSYNEATGEFTVPSSPSLNPYNLDAPAGGLFTVRPLTPSQQYAAGQSYDRIANLQSYRRPSLYGKPVYETFDRPFEKSSYNSATGEFRIPYSGGEEQARNDVSRIAIRNQLEQQGLNFLQRRIELLTGPGGELQAAREIAAIRFASGKTELEKASAVYDLEIRTLELAKQRENAIRGFGQQAFGALLGGRSGITNFVRGQLTNIGSTIAGNAAVQLFGGASSPFSLTNDPNSGLGKLLAGTPFGADPMRDAAVDLKSAAKDLTMAAAVLSGGTIASGGTAGIGGVLGALGIPTGVFQGAGRNPMIFSNSGGFSGTGGEMDEFDSIMSVRRNNPFLTNSGQSSVAAGLFKSGASNQERAISGIATGLALYGGYEGVSSGIREGGARGGLGAASSALATAAAIDPEPVSKAILAAAAAITGIVRSVLPDPKTTRGKDLQAALDAASYSSPSSTQFDLFAGSGATYDYDFRGGRREQPITIMVQTLDARSFMDNSGMIADAVREAMQNGHSLNQTAREAALAQ